MDILILCCSLLTGISVPSLATQVLEKGAIDEMRYMIGSVLSIAVPILHIVASWRYSDWRNWTKYYPTILLSIVVDFFTSIVTYSHPLWIFHKTLFIPNHTLTDVMIALIILPTTILIYLTHYPYKSSFKVQLLYMAFWVAMDSLFEYAFVITKMITYHNNWNFGWTVLFWVFMISVFRLHHTKPLLAWLVCIGFTIFVVSYFHIPITKLK